MTAFSLQSKPTAPPSAAVPLPGVRHLFRAFLWSGSSKAPLKQYKNDTPKPWRPQTFRMKKQPQYVPSVTRLAERIGLSRQWCQELMRLPDCPKVTKQGHSVVAWKAYITKRAEKIQSQAGLRSKLQIDLLQARLAREAHD